MVPKILIRVEKEGYEFGFPNIKAFHQYRSIRIQEVPSYLAASIQREIEEQQRLENELSAKIGAPQEFLEGICLTFGTAERTKELFRNPAVVLAILDPTTYTDITISATAKLTYTSIIALRGTIRFIYPSANSLIPGY
jgi:hypothetical protein